MTQVEDRAREAARQTLENAAALLLESAEAAGRAQEQANAVREGYGTGDMFTLAQKHRDAEREAHGVLHDLIATHARTYKKFPQG